MITVARLTGPSTAERELELVDGHDLIKIGKTPGERSRIFLTRVLEAVFSTESAGCLTDYPRSVLFGFEMTGNGVFDLPRGMIY